MNHAIIEDVSHLPQQFRRVLLVVIYQGSESVPKSAIDVAEAIKNQDRPEVVISVIHL